MSLPEEFRIAVMAAQAGIRVNTDEINDAIATITRVCASKCWKLYIYDAARGLYDGIVGTVITPPQDAGAMPSPPGKGLSLIQSFAAVTGLRLTDDEEGAVVLVVKNLHLECGGASRTAMSATIQNFVVHGNAERKFLVGMMPAEEKLPSEIRELFQVIDHELPDEAELGDILDGVTDDPNVDRRSITKAALGLTRLQAEGAFANSMARDGAVLAADVWKAKAAALNREGLVELRENRLSFSDVGGLAGFKDFLRRLTAYDPLDDVDPDARARGVMAVGPPGVGKSLMAECLGKELNLPTLAFNPGNLMGEHVGVTERNTRKFFQIIRRMAPCVVIADEIGQTMGNGKNSNSAVDSRMLGSFLTAMNDIREPVFWFFTANDVEDMHEAFTRAERIDAMIYVRLPDVDQRAQVWQIYVRKFFPAEVKGQPDPRHVATEMMRHMAALREAHGDDHTRAVHAAGAFLMTLPEAQRRPFLDAIEEFGSDTALMVEAQLIDDDKWTPAEIRACCRLARRLNLPLHEAARRISHKCLGTTGTHLLTKLGSWATDAGAIDSETGVVYTPEDGRKPAEGSKVRRKIKRG